MQRYLPVLFGVLMIVGLTIPQYMMTDRLSGTNVTAEQRAKLLEKVPENIGDWRGENMAVDPIVRETAGAVGAVSRVYRNVRTGETVDLWLIVGHAKDIVRHTPNICYRGSGFEACAAEDSVYPLVEGDETLATFLTNTFYKEDSLTGRTLKRVFWTWYNPDEDENEGKVVWEASKNIRRRAGNTRGLYKMYFTSNMKDSMETTEQSACMQFAREFLPVVNAALAEVQLGETSASTTEPAAGASAPAAADQETPAASSDASIGSEPAITEAPSATGTPSATEIPAAIDTPPVSTDPLKQ
jgi:hypothetical protein